jgi:hypothetical protein
MMRILALGALCAASLCGQQRFSWQDACFKNPAAPYCPGHEFAVKPAPPSAAPRSVVTGHSFSSTQRGAAPAMIVVGGIDWRFADPFPDVLVGFNFSSLAASPLARSLISQLGARQGLTDADLQKIFDGLAGVDQVAFSARGNQVVVMVTGAVADSTLPAPEAGWKAVPISGNAMLVGTAGAVDDAVRRINMKVPPSELTRLAEERQASSEFWAVGSAGLIGPQLLSAGVKRFSLIVSVRDRLISDVAFEFNGMPDERTLRMWQSRLGNATLEGNALHLRMAMEADEVQAKFGRIAAGPVGERLAALVKASRYLPVRDASVPLQTKPAIYGLDDGPRVVNQDSNR